MTQINEIPEPAPVKWTLELAFIAAFVFGMPLLFAVLFLWMMIDSLGVLGGIAMAALFVASVMMWWIVWKPN